MAELLKIAPQVPNLATGVARIPRAGLAIAGGLDRLGVDMSRVSGHLQQQAEREQEQDDIFAAEAQINKLHDVQHKLAYGEKGALTLKGENVFKLGEPLTDFYTRQYDEEAKALGDQLANDNQKRRFAIMAGRVKNQFGRQLQVHEANETNNVRESTFKGVVASETEALSQALDDPDPGVRQRLVGQSVGRVNANALNFYVNQMGLSKEQAQGEILKLESSMHKTVIDRYLEQNRPADAKAYFEQMKHRISAKDAEVARKQIVKDNRDAMVMTEADRIWNTLGPKADSDVVNLDRMEREAGKAFTDDADGRKLLIAEIRQRREAHDYSVKQRQNDIVGGIWKQAIDRVPLAQLRRSPEFRSLDGKTQAQMIDQIEEFQKPKTDPNQSMERFIEYWAVASNPERLAAMSDAEIFARAPQMGTELVKRALEDKRRLSTAETKVIEAKIDQDSFNHFARQAGFDPSKKGDKATLGELKYRVETEIDVAQRQAKRALNRDEKDALVKRLLTEVPVRQSTSFLGIPTGTTVDNKRLYEVEYAHNIAIPAGDRQTVVKALKGAGIENPSEAQIREGYIRLKMK